MSDINIVKKPISQLTVEFNEKMWEVLEINKEKDLIRMKSFTDDKKEITRNLSNSNILYCSY